MKSVKLIPVFLLALLIAASTAVAGDFGWTRDFNVQAQADPSGFRGRIATRFKLGDATVNAVLSNFDDPADAYIALRLGEMAGRSPDYVVDRYRRHKSKGWGALAKELGIKPGSAEFHALKQGHDLYGGNDRRHASTSDHGNKKNNGKGKGKK